VEKSERENYRGAGKIAAKALRIGCEEADEGVKLIDVARSIENYIKEMDANIAFPVNISINEIAAHYTPGYNDERKFKSGDLVKLDVGAHIEGYIGDTARSFVTGVPKENEIELINCSQRALNGALKAIRAGITLNEIGGIVENICRAQGFVSVRNLSGHSLEKFNLHSGISVPNFANGDLTKIREGIAIAIEPFATDGKGMVTEKEYGNIYRYRYRQRGNNEHSQEDPLMEIIRSYRGLPFAERWLYDLEGKRVRAKMRRLVSKGILTGYRVLVEKKNGYVAQSEHTVLVNKHGCEVTTR